MCLFRRNLFCGNRFTQAHGCAYSVPTGTPLNINSLQMETSRFDDEMNELAARPLHAQQHAVRMTVRSFTQIFQRKKPLQWGEHAHQIRSDVGDAMATANSYRNSVSAEVGG